ncbi:PREDICTED: uncharacterized protein LOC104594183 [Nelumbo nucifera]|uniref:Uncharacterized protein LOC104594183 n=1 Tax=Nelumbo nucifera TaxID=4432 RepID=A0A1U7ZHZ6_NELNU|nr:PREDICTED: uncharacterized protein LOC104594183 [Nelumbo nucifera]
MAFPLGAPTTLSIPKGGDAIYVAAIPLRAAKGPAQMLMSAAYSLNMWDLQHYMVIISTTPPPQAFVFDFQPQDPENMYVALAALSSRGVPGVVLVRKLRKLPKRKCWFVGFSRGDSIEKANKFNESWQTELSIGQHDCRDYTNGLVEHLTGEKHVLDRLRTSSDG